MPARLPPLARRAARLLVDVRFGPAQGPHERAHRALRVGADALDVPVVHGPWQGVAGWLVGVDELVDPPVEVVHALDAGGHESPRAGFVLRGRGVIGRAEWRERVG